MKKTIVAMIAVFLLFLLFIVAGKSQGPNEEKVVPEPDYVKEMDTEAGLIGKKFSKIALGRLEAQTKSGRYVWTDKRMIMLLEEYFIWIANIMMFSRVPGEVKVETINLTMENLVERYAEWNAGRIGKEEYISTLKNLLVKKGVLNVSKIVDISRDHLVEIRTLYKTPKD